MENLLCKKKEEVSLDPQNEVTLHDFVPQDLKVLSVWIVPQPYVAFEYEIDSDGTIDKEEVEETLTPRLTTWWKRGLFKSPLLKLKNMGKVASKFNVFICYQGG